MTHQELVVNREFVKKLRFTRSGLASFLGFRKRTNSDNVRNALLESGVCNDSEDAEAISRDIHNRGYVRIPSPGTYDDGTDGLMQFFYNGFDKDGRTKYVVHSYVDMDN